MSDTYPVRLGDACIGEACVSRQGLYYQIVCSCQLSEEVVYRIQVSGGEKAENLGILAPENGRFTVRSRIAISKLGAEPLSFRAVPQHAKTDEPFYPLCPDEPFTYLSRIDEMFLSKRGSQIGLRVKK